jgi:four helix bundle protein
MRNYRELKIYHKALKLSSRIYHLTCRFPSSEAFSLANQLRRAAYSIVLNIAEGAGSDSTKEFIMYLGHSVKSGFEVAAGLDIARELDFIDQEEYRALLNDTNEVTVMIKSFRDVLKRDVSSRSTAQKLKGSVSKKSQ